MIPFFWTFQTVTIVCIRIAIRILSCSSGTPIIPNLLVGGVEAVITLTRPACLVVVDCFVLAKGRIRRFIRRWGLLLPASRIIVATFRTISQAAIVSCGHILQNHLTPEVWVSQTAPVLILPLDVELGTMVDSHNTLHRPWLILVVVSAAILANRRTPVPNLVACSGIVLRVEQAVLVLRIVALLG
jgi:hypothetical protein